LTQGIIDAAKRNIEKEKAKMWPDLKGKVKTL
jgi:hypothetical protein